MDPIGARARHPDPSEPVEVEVKLAVGRPELIRELIEHPDPSRLAGFEPIGPVRVVTLTDRYLDTGLDDGRLFVAGMRARLRDAGDGVTITVKRRGSVDGTVTTRVELEAPANASVDPDAWPASVAKDAIEATAGNAALRQIAALRQRRTARDFRSGETDVELSLDEMDALDGDRAVDHRVEVEAELKSGPVAPLHALADALSRLDGVGPALGSKLDFALRGARSAAPRGPDPVPER